MFIILTQNQINSASMIQDKENETMNFGIYISFFINYITHFSLLFLKRLN